MRRIFLLLMLCSFAIAHADSFKDIFIEENRNFGVGFFAGQVGAWQHSPIFVMGMSFSYKGIYADFGGWPSWHGDDARVGRWKDERAFMFHGGYTIPVTPYLRFTPLVGYVWNERGFTDGYDWTSNGYGIHNKFNAEGSNKWLDYGIQITGNINKFNIHATFTRHAWYAGVGIEFHFK